MTRSTHGASLLAAVALALACRPATNLDEEPGASTTEDVAATTGSAGDSSASGEGSSGGPPCDMPPLEQGQLDSLFLVGEAVWTNRVQVGQTMQLWPTYEIGAGGTHHAAVCAEWSIEPVEGVSIQAWFPGALLEIAPDVPPGTIITVTADIENGRRVITQQFETYVPVESPIRETWEEILQIPCDGSEPFVPEPAIRTVAFTLAREFFVDWPSSDLYPDYAGTYAYDERTGALSLFVEWGTRIPEDVDGEGTAVVADGQLVLQDMWLGTAPEPVTAAACGHVLE
jgi:hypothetical protein